MLAGHELTLLVSTAQLVFLFIYTFFLRLAYKSELYLYSICIVTIQEVSI